MRDFIIIGGGIAGISAAARLAELGSVTLLETEDSLGYHTSSRSAALFEPNYGPPVSRALAVQTEAHLRDMGALTPRGFLLVAKEGDPLFETDRDSMALTEISISEARALCPILAEDVTRAAQNRDCWDIDTDLLLQDFAKTARALGAELRTKSPVQAIARGPNGWRVTTPEGDFEGKMLVNAAGAWADPIAQMAGLAPLGITPMRRSMARIAAPGGHDISGWPMIFGTGESWYAKPDAGALIVSPAEEDPTEPHDAWADDMVLAEGLDRYQQHVSEPVERLLASWAGLRSFAADRELVLGRAPQDESFIWCAGQGGFGMQTSAGVAQLLADLVGGRPPALEQAMIDKISPARFANASS